MHRAATHTLEGQPGWVLSQEKTFSAWTNFYLSRDDRGKRFVWDAIDGYDRTRWPLPGVAIWVCVFFFGGGLIGWCCVM